MKTILMLILLGNIELVFADQGFLIESREPHKFQVLNHGPSSFWKRLEVLDRAKESIDIEYFIYHEDEVGKLFALKLIEKAKQGVNVRLLLDRSIFGTLSRYHITYLMKNGIKVRWYNDRSIIQFIDAQYRNHKKVIIVDGKEAIVGGRNMADDYYNNNKDYNFIDRDVWVEGPVVKNMIKVFESFWTHKITSWVEKAKRPIDHNFGRTQRRQWEKRLEKYKKRMREAREFSRENSLAKRIRTKFKSASEKVLKETPIFTCDHIQYASDGPGPKDSARFMGKFIFSMFEKAQTELVMETPYFVSLENEQEIYGRVLEKGVDITLFTNSVQSTDNLFIANHFNRHIPFYAGKGLQAFVHYGNPLKNQGGILQKSSATMPWGTHAKTIVFDEINTLIGSYNLDPRSLYYSAENAMVCLDQPRIADYVKSSIKSRIEEAGLGLDENGMPVDGSGQLLGIGLLKRFKYVASTFISTLFDFWL